MEQQVLSLEKMRHLQELGVDTSKASMCWNRIVRPANKPNTEDVVVLDWFVNTHKAVMHTPFDRVDVVPAFTLQDILDLLPVSIKDGDRIYELRIKRMIFGGEKVMYSVLYEEQYSIDWYIMYSYPNLLDSAYEMLCWCIEQGYVETKKVK